MSSVPVVFIVLMILTVYTTGINDDKAFQSHDICLLKQFDTHEKGSDYNDSTHDNNEHNIMNINQYTVVISIFVVAIFILYFLYPTQSIHQPPAINQPPAIHQP
eukprot:207273_1